MKQPKFPRNKYLDEGSKKILNETFILDRLEGIFQKFVAEGTEMSDKDFQNFLREIYDLALQINLNLTGENTSISCEERELIRKRIKILIQRNPGLTKLLKENAIELDENISFSRIKEVLMSNKLSEISTNKESIDFLTDLLTQARERSYNLIAGKNKAIKDKVDTIYGICKRIFTSDNVEKVNKVFSSELYTRTISLIQNYSSVVKSFRTLTRNTKNKDRAYLNSLRDQYFILFGDSEIFVKLLYAIKLTANKEEVDTQTILGENVGNLITALNRAYPGLIDFDTRIRNAIHSGGVRYRNGDAEIVFSTKKKPDLVLEKEQFIKECKKSSNTAFALFSIQHVIYLFMYDTMLDRIELENSNYSKEFKDQ